MKTTLLSITLASVLLARETSAADWPMWRYDGGRSAASPTALPEELDVLWTRQFPEPKPAFRSKRLQFDAGYEPIVLGKTLFVGSSVNDRVTALDTETGAERWRFYAGGPVRLAPVGWKSRVYFGSDDGHLYCLNVDDGSIAWKFRAVPSSRKILGNGRLISVWPIRGGPVVSGGRIYFAAGVWSFEGVFVYALDAATGEVAWRNDRAGFIYGSHPHGASAFGGLTPQGYLVVNGDELVVPCGPTVPATFDLETGKLKSFALPAQSRLPGGWFAALSKEKRRGIEFDSEINRDQHEDKVYTGEGAPGVRSTVTFGEKSYRFGDGWPGIEGEIHSMLAADDKLVVVTRDGTISCLGAGSPAPAASKSQPRELDRRDGSGHELGELVLRAAAVRHGYALVLGLTSGGLIEELVRSTDLKVIGIDRDRRRVDTLRRRLDEAGLYGSRVSLHEGDLATFGGPPYLASLIVSEDAARAGLGEDATFASNVYRALRPYGGVACFELTSGMARAFRERVGALALPGAEVESADSRESLVLLRRAGALPGATDYVGGWGESPDARVKAPVGVLWFDDTLGHFKRSPQPKFVGGLMISHPKDWRSGDKPPYRLTPAIYSDVYTGRVLSAGETTRVAGRLPREDLNQIQPNQYRPPSQKNAWKPEPPRPGRRINPLTGRAEARVFPKSYGCDGGVDYGYIYTMRSGTPAYYDKRNESGTIHISGPRSGCTNSLIPANGLLNVPYFYEGCTCSYPLPVGLALVPMPPEYEQWASWGAWTPESDAPDGGSIQRVGINFGAPGDRVAGGTLWLDVPSVGGPSPEIEIETQPESPDVFYRHSLWIEGGRGWPWVAASGARGLSSVTLEGLTPGRFTVRLYFAEPDHARSGERRFAVSLQGQPPVLEGFDIAREAGGRMRGIVREFREVISEGTLTVKLSATNGRPILCGLEIVADGLPMAEIPTMKERLGLKEER